MKVNAKALPPARKAAFEALRTARWARIMTKWLIRHSSKEGVKWQLVDFCGKHGQESAGIVDLMAIRKNHKKPDEGGHRGDMFEIVLIQVKGGSAPRPKPKEIERMLAVIRRTMWAAKFCGLTRSRSDEPLSKCRLVRSAR